ncbi:MAG: O-linked N-acetylglucosamine transferase, SPINDLY family protein [Kaiparowitsia implicata GSE-PSE-MK54-09C]|nr:O-linked N-acetylglucosamine transferase, SPINDLY family protein [Kaiparowitsia implicata GSE-PSE-MK54-09C]
MTDKHSLHSGDSPTSRLASPASELQSRSMAEQVAECMAQGQFGSAIALCETWTDAAPTDMQARWQLGLAYLLEGQEEAAQLTWTLAMAEGDESDVARWTEELQAVLAAAATQLANDEQGTLAWVARQYIRELDPENVNNLLALLGLSLELKQFDPDEFERWGLVEALSPEANPALSDDGGLDLDLLDRTMHTVLTHAPESWVLVPFMEAALSQVGDRKRWLHWLKDHIADLKLVLANHALSLRYAEMCHPFNQDDLPMMLQLAGLYQDQERYDQGIEIAQQHISRSSSLVEKLTGSSVLMRGLMLAGGRWEEATRLAEHNKALTEQLLQEYSIDPDRPLGAEVMCTSGFYWPYLRDRPRDTRALQNRVSAFYQASAQAHVAKHHPDYQPYPQKPLVRSDRPKLRIGVLSRSMRLHSVGWLSRWLFKHYDRSRFEVYAYFNQQRRIDPFGQEWFANRATRACCFDGDQLGVAKHIQEDEIDILLDLDSLTSDLCCSVFALKPAPVQVTWLGLDASGLPAIDYFVADSYVVPEEADEYYAEKLWRLPRTYIAVDGFEVGVPTLRRYQLGIPADAVIFFSSQVSFKRHPATIRLQMQIIKGVPGSYFLIKGLGDAEAVKQQFEQIAEEEGVAGDRLRFLPLTQSEFEHRANLGIADVVLDTFPYNGATTTLETLWMGVPLVTRVGQQFASRNSYGMLRNAGITEGIAHTDAEYVAWGIRLGQDAALRQQIHWALLRSRQTAPLWDGQAFTRDMEHAFEQMWAQRE